MKEMPMGRPSPPKLGRLRVLARKLIQPTVIELDGIRVSAEDKSVRKWLYKGTYEWRERTLVRRAISRGDRVLEIGAGIGLISILCAKLCGDDSVVSYEANPKLESLIRTNYALNGVSPELRMEAVAPSRGSVSFFIHDSIISSSLRERKDSKQTQVQAASFEDVMSEVLPNCLIMDAEGGECELLGKSRLSGVNKIILETHPRVVGLQANQALLTHIHEIGFQAEKTLGDVIFLLRK